MGARSVVQKRIDKLQGELAGFHAEYSEIVQEIQSREFALQELLAVLKTLPEDEDSAGNEIALRKGSDAAKSRDSLRKAQAPLHVDVLLQQIGKSVDKKSRVSLAGQLSLYVRKGQIFTRPEPNTFGLKEWETRTPLEAKFFSDGPFTLKVPVPVDDEDPPALSLDENDAH